MYRATNGAAIQRIADGAIIPVDVRNRDYQDVQAWLAAGNTLGASVAAPVVKPLFKVQLIEAMTDAEAQILDDFLDGKAPGKPTTKQKLRFREAVELDRTNPELTAMAVQLFGAERAAILLAVGA